jgi:hypothetical protein
LYAESSEDGKNILLTLNKPVTSDISEVNPGDFFITCSDDTMEVVAITAGENSPNTILITLAEPLYYGGIVKLSCQGSTIFSGDQALGVFSNADVKNNLPVRYTLPMRIQAEDFSFNNGLVSESCSDAGGGMDMGYAAPGDYLDYRVFVPQSRYYTINFRIATIRASSQLIIRAGGEGNPYTDIDTLIITSTGDWQAWETMPINVFLQQGRYSLRLYVRSGEFNTNWFQVVNASGTGLDTEKKNHLQVYPNPADDYVMIDLAGLNNGTIEISIYNTLGQLVKNMRALSGHATQIMISDLDKGLYYVVAKRDNSVVLTSRLVVL